MSARNDNIFVTRGIVYGTRSRPIESPDTDASHEWTVYLYSPFNTPMNYIEHVTFTLHETFINPVLIKKFPFEHTEQGWGEFSIGIKITFKDPNEKPITFSHNLVLHEGFEENGYIIHERYDEIVFRSPTVFNMPLLAPNDQKSQEFIAEEKEELENIERAIETMLSKIENI